jgi:hypothetical protein
VEEPLTQKRLPALKVSWMGGAFSHLKTARLMLQGVIVELSGTKCFLRADMQPSDCKQEDLFFVSLKRFRK